MRILLIFNAWPTLFISSIYREIAWMRARGHHIAVVALERSWSSEFVDLEAYGLNDLPVLELEPGTGSIAEMVISTLAYIRRQKIEVIMAHTALMAAEIARHIRLEAGIPYLVRMHGSDVHTRPPANMAQIVEQASAILPVSQYLADLLVGRRPAKELPPGLPVAVDPAKLRVLHNAISGELIADEPAAQSDDLQIVGSTGRINPGKRQRDILEAVGKLAGEFPNLRLRLIGGGPSMAEVQERAREMQLDHRVEITGHLPWPEAMKLVEGLHIYVHASQYEGCSMAAIEGAARGLPLILSRTGANEFCVDQNINGYLLEPGDVEGMIISLRALLSMAPEQRQEMGAASLRIIRERFVLENLLPRLEAFYKAVLDGQSLPE